MRGERGPRAQIERDVPGLPAAPPFLEDADADRVVEAPRPGAGRIEIPDAGAALVVRQVAVAEEDHVGGGAAQLGENFGPRALRAIEDVHEEEAQPADLRPRRLARRAAAEIVDVAGAGRDGRDGAQLVEHRFAADVAGVKDVVDAAEGLEHFGAEQAMRIRDDADAHRWSIRRGMLLVATPRAWTTQAIERFDEVLVDHAHCEKKAAAHALSLLAAFPQVPGLARAMARLAREEAGHLGQVLRLLEQRGLVLGRDAGDPYAQGLQAQVRQPARERLLDRLLISALIEARSEERLRLLGEALPDPELRNFYARLATSEAGHFRLFLRLARNSTGAEFQPRLDQLLQVEARLIQDLPLRPAIH